MADFYVEYFQDDDGFYSSFEYQIMEGRSERELIQKIEEYFKEKYGPNIKVDISKGVSQNDPK